MAEIVIKPLSETQFSIEDIYRCIHSSFCQWTEHGLDSSVAKYSLMDFVNKTKKHTVLVAYEKERVLGTYTLDFERPQCCFGKYMAVSPEAKRMGIGTMLLEKSFEIAVQRGCEYVLTDTAEKAYWSVKWHEKNGLRKIGLKSFTTNNYYSIIFRKQLIPSKKWDSRLYCRTRFVLSCIFTKLTKKSDGHFRWIFEKLFHFVTR